jgi:hypothetical protein
MAVSTSVVVLIAAVPSATAAPFAAIAIPAAHFPAFDIPLINDSDNLFDFSSVFEMLFSASLESTNIDPIKENIDIAIAAPPFI